MVPFNCRGRFFLIGALGFSKYSFDVTGPYVFQMFLAKNEPNREIHFIFFNLLLVFVTSSVASCLAKFGSEMNNFALPTGFPRNFVPE